MEVRWAQASDGGGAQREDKDRKQAQGSITRRHSTFDCTIPNKEDTAHAIYGFTAASSKRFQLG
jgi:hypothetical protein